MLKECEVRTYHDVDFKEMGENMFSVVCGESKTCKEVVERKE